MTMTSRVTSDQAARLVRLGAIFGVAPDAETLQALCQTHQQAPVVKETPREVQTLPSRH